jgi:hypothetical protein
MPLYVAFSTHQRGANHADIVVRTSYDHGRTWSQPVTATPQDSVIYFQPNPAVDEAGRVAVSAFALASGRIDEVVLLSPPHQLRFGAPLRVTTAFDPHSRTATARSRRLVDRRLPGITAGAGAFHLVWNETRTGKMELSTRWRHADWPALHLRPHGDLGPGGLASSNRRKFAAAQVPGW